MVTRETIDKLDAVNARFYEEHGPEFAAARQHPWKGWSRLIPLIEKLAAPHPAETSRPRTKDEGEESRDIATPKTNDGLRVLDLGCAHGRFLKFLLAHEIPIAHYTGLDLSETLLNQARQDKVFAEISTHFEKTDITKTLQTPKDEYDSVTVFGVLHHMTSAQRAKNLIDNAFAKLAPGGLLVSTLWQFHETGKFAQKRITLEEYNSRAAPGEALDAEALPDSSVLVSFGKTRHARYCNFFEPSDITAIFDTKGSALLETFRADGSDDKTNLYVLLQKPAVFASSLCHQCEHLKMAGNSRGSQFMMCRALEKKYVPQPVSQCSEFARREIVAANDNSE